MAKNMHYNFEYICKTTLVFSLCS